MNKHEASNVKPEGTKGGARDPNENTVIGRRPNRLALADFWNALEGENAVILDTLRHASLARSLGGTVPCESECGHCRRAIEYGFGLEDKT